MLGSQESILAKSAPSCTLSMVWELVNCGHLTVRCGSHLRVPQLPTPTTHKGTQVCSVYRPDHLPLGLAQTTMHLALVLFSFKTLSPWMFLEEFDHMFFFFIHLHLTHKNAISKEVVYDQEPLLNSSFLLPSSLFVIILFLLCLRLFLLLLPLSSLFSQKKRWLSTLFIHLNI